MQKRRAEGLCFRCPEKYHPGHKCNPPQFLLVVDNDDGSDGPTQTDDQLTQPEIDPSSLLCHELNAPPHCFSLSSAAFLGITSPRALRITAHIGGHPVSVLIDSGSTHNIIQPRIAAFLKLPITPIPSFQVMVGNGSNIQCTGFCDSATLQLPATSFTVPFFVLPIEGANVVLDMQWLSTLGPVSADFAKPQLSFQHNGHTVTLRGEPTSTPASPSTIHHLLQKQAVASLHTLIYQPHSPFLSHNHQDTFSPQVNNLLLEFSNLFETPSNLPPNRNQDHFIPIHPNAPPVNVRPYRYPHYQKQIMTDLISEMLHDGIIKPSQSPYSSPVLLVRKKDGTWSFCVDYRDLNAITICDRFSIPTVDELFDELHNARIFSKID